MDITPFSLQLFEATPGKNALIKANPPFYTIVAVTEGFVQGAGKPKALLVNSNIFAIFPSNPNEPADAGADELKASFEKVTREKKAHTISSHRYDVLNTESIYIERHWKVINSPILDANGEVSYIIHSPEEITSRIKAEQLEKEHAALSGTNAYLQQIINLFNAPLQVLEPVFENDRIIDFRFKMTNAAYAAYANTTPEALQYKKVGDVFPGYFQTSSFTNVVKTYETGIADTFEIHYNLDGLDIYNVMSTTKMDSEVVVHFTEYTKLKHLQLQLERKVMELERSNQHLAAFAYAASHDLKEPIRKIHIFSERLKSSLGEKLNATEQQYFQRMELAASRMGSLIDQLLLYAEVNQQAESNEWVDLNVLFKQVLSDLDLQIEQKGASIEVASLFRVRGHAHQLQQAFENIIGNSLKYMKPDTIPHIQVACLPIKGSQIGLSLSLAEQTNDYYLLTITDNGIGFAQEDAERIFNVFTRLHGTTEYKGTGIGLSIVRKVIENHKGAIWAESTPGQGARFNIVLPAGTAEDALGN